MPTLVMTQTANHRTPLPEPSAAQVRLLRELVTSSARPSKQILLDTEIDGVRCTLTRRADTPPGVCLSPREQEIARMIAKGLANKTIAQVLEISTWTVGTYLRRIFSKLDVSSRAAMVARLMELGLMEAKPDQAVRKP